MSKITQTQEILLNNFANFLTASTNNMIMNGLSVDRITELITEHVDSTLSDLPKLGIELQEGVSWLNNTLQKAGYLGKYLNSDFFPLRQIRNIGANNYRLAQDLVREASPGPPGDDSVFEPILAALSVPDLQKTTPSAPPPPGYTPSPMVTVSNVSSQSAPSTLDHDVSIHPMRYQGELPPLGIKELDPAGYSKLKELSKTINSKLPIESILDRFSSWAKANNLRYTDEGYKLALGTVLPDSMIKTYDYLASDKTVPYHHLAYLLSKKLGSRKTFKIARAFGEELACNLHDPPLKVLDEIETLFYNVEGRDRKSLAEESFLLAETFLTRRFGEKFWALFQTRLQAEKIDTISDLMILFKNHYVRVAQIHEEEKNSSKKTSNRLHHLEEESVTREQIQLDVKSILSKLESPPLHQDRATSQMTGANNFSSNMDQGYYTIPTSHGNQCYSSHHLAPAPAPHPQPIVMPVVFPGHSGGGQRQSQGRQPRGNQKTNPFNIPAERQYTYQTCCFPGHSGHLNKDCHDQAKIQCNYNARHAGHNANECIRSRDWHFGAIEDPNRPRYQVRGNPGGRPGYGPQARLASAPQRPPPRQPQASGVNQILEALRTGFQGLANSSA